MLKKIFKKGYGIIRNILSKLVNELIFGFNYFLWEILMNDRRLIKTLSKYYENKFKREWIYCKNPPHFSDNRAGIFNIAFTDKGIGPYSLYRGFFSSEMVSEDDYLLDIGCGDGFFTKHFFSEKCKKIDAIDIEQTAIKEAKSSNQSKKINYYLIDAVKSEFPDFNYDIIVWDGAIGHFSTETTNSILEKILRSLKNDGVFVGSESLGDKEGRQDHLQFFYSLDDFFNIFKNYFKYIELRKVDYIINNSFIREEAYWRCSNDRKRLEMCSWKKFYK